MFGEIFRALGKEKMAAPKEASRLAVSPPASPADNILAQLLESPREEAFPDFAEEVEVRTKCEVDTTPSPSITTLSPGPSVSSSSLVDLPSPASTPPGRLPSSATSALGGFSRTRQPSPPALRNTPVNASMLRMR